MQTANRTRHKVNKSPSRRTPTRKAALHPRPETRPREKQFAELLVESSAYGLYAFDGNCRYVIWNPAMERMSGVSRAQTIGKRAFDVFPLLREAGEDKYLLDALEGKSVISPDRPYAIPGIGVQGTFEVHYGPLLGPSGKIVGGYGLVRDVARRKQAEQEILRRSQEVRGFGDIDRALSRLAEPSEIFELIYATVGRVLGNRGFYIALYDERAQQLTFPIFTMEGRRLKPYTRPFANSITEYVIRTKAPLLIPCDVQATTAKLGIELKYKTPPPKSLLGVPLLAGDRVIGVLMLQDYDREYAYDAESLALLSRFGSQAAIAVENARLFEETQRRARQFAALYETAVNLSTERELNVLLQTIVEQAAKLLGTSSGAIYVYDAARGDLQVRVATGPSVPIGTRLQLGEGMAGRVARTRAPLIVSDYRMWSGRSPQYEGVPIRAVAGVPMLYSGELIGVLDVHEIGEATREFTDADARLLSLFAAQAASAVDNARLFEEARRRAQRQEALMRVSRELAHVGVPQELCETVVRAGRGILGYHYMGIFLLEPDTGDRVLRAQSGWDDAPKDWRLHPGEGLSEQACLTGELQYYPDVRCEPRYVPGLRESRSEVDVPIKIDHSVLGVLVVEDARVDGFTKDDFEVLKAVASQLAVALENARLFQDTNSRLAQLAALQETIKAVVSTLHLDELLHLITRQASTLVQGDGGILNLVDWEKKEDEVVAANGSCSHTIGFRSPLEDSLSGWVTLHNQPIISNQLQSDARVDRYVRSGAMLNQSAAIAPLTIKDQVIGTLVVLDKQGGKKGFAPSDLDLLTAFASQAAAAIENARLYEAVQRELVERKRAEEALTEDRNLLRTLIDALPDFIYVKDAQGRYVIDNVAHQRFMGAKTPEEVAGKSVFDVFPEELAARHQADDQGVIESGEPLINREEQVFYRTTGATAWHATTKVPLRDSRGKIVGLVGISRDISKRKQAEEALVKRTSELEQAYKALQENQESLAMSEKMASLGRLTAGIAHEMNTPLATVRSSLFELRRLAEEYQSSIGDPAITPEDHRQIAIDMEQSIGLAETAAERSAAFVRGIKAQTRDLAVDERQRFDALPIIRDTLLLLSHALRKAGCRAGVETAADQVELYGSPGRLSQVITNLVTNAIDASVPKGGGPLTLRLTPHSDAIELEVIDEGCGIAPEILPKIFDPMFTTKPFGQGTGLGLTIVRDIVTGDFGGKIDVCTEVGRGTTMRVHFPMPKEES